MKRKVYTTQLPENSMCRNYIEAIDFKDTYKVKLGDGDISIENIYINVFAHSPKWVNNLLALRNKIVGVFGLDTNKNRTEITKDNLKTGSKTGIFRIYSINENEIIAGEDEKHLNFRVSVLKENGETFFSTLVQYNNWFGRFYFFIVKPFHKLVVKVMLKNAVKNGRI